MGVNRPALQLDQPLAFNRLPNMTFHLLVRVCKPLSPEADPQVPSERARPCSRADWGARPLQDTQEEDAVPSHTAQATLVLEVQPADLRPPWFLPCVYSDLYVCVQAQYYGAIPTGHKLVPGTGRGRASSGRLGVGTRVGGWVPQAQFCQDFQTNMNIPVPPHGRERGAKSSEVGVRGEPTASVAVLDVGGLMGPRGAPRRQLPL